MEKQDTDPLYRELQLTSDGSHTLYLPGMDEHYHSVNGAIQESRHVFVEAGLHQLRSSEIHLLEIGFGTGLNALLTLLDAGEKGVNIHYTAIELYPLPLPLIRQLNYGKKLSPENERLFLLLHEAAWEHPVTITDRFTLHKIKGDFNHSPFPPKTDLVYFDAFAPDKQPDVWNLPLFERLYIAMSVGGVLTTYCAKGMVRRMLQSVGFEVERIPGPPGKREMLRARKIK